MASPNNDVALFGPRTDGSLNTGLTIQLSIDAAAAAAAKGSENGVMMLLRYWWECAPVPMDEDAAHTWLTSRGGEDAVSSLWLRTMRCVVPPMTAASRDSPPEARELHSSVAAGDYLTGNASWGGFRTTLGTSSSDTSGFWALRRLPAGRVTLAWVPLHDSATCWKCDVVFRVTVVIPPIIHVGGLLAPGDSDTAQLATMQCLIDAAQDVGYFFVVTSVAAQCHSVGSEVTGSARTTNCGNDAVALGVTCLRHMRQGVNDARALALRLPHDATASLPQLVAPTVCKFTIHSSTGEVKVSSNPLAFQHIVPPAWLTEADMQTLVIPYYQSAKELALVLMEALAQDDIREEDLYLLLRAVVYPPPDPAASPPATPLPPTTLDVHTDKSWVTLLLSTSLHGLMFQSADGCSYDPIVPEGLKGVAVRQPRNSLDGDVSSDLCVVSVEDQVMAVNIGDAFQMSSRGAFLSRPHMAVHPRGTHSGAVDSCRVSLPLFVEPALGHWPTPYTSEDVVAIPI